MATQFNSYIVVDVICVDNNDRLRHLMIPNVLNISRSDINKCYVQHANYKEHWPDFTNYAHYLVSRRHISWKHNDPGYLEMAALQWIIWDIM